MEAWKFKPNRANRLHRGKYPTTLDTGVYAAAAVASIALAGSTVMRMGVFTTVKIRALSLSLEKYSSGHPNRPQAVKAPSRIPFC